MLGPAAPPGSPGRSRADFGPMWLTKNIVGPATPLKTCIPTQNTSRPITINRRVHPHFRNMSQVIQALPRAKPSPPCGATVRISIAKPSVSPWRSRPYQYREAVCINIAKPSVCLGENPGPSCRTHTGAAPLPGHIITWPRTRSFRLWASDLNTIVSARSHRRPTHCPLHLSAVLFTRGNALRPQQRPFYLPLLTSGLAILERRTQRPLRRNEFRQLALVTMGGGPREASPRCGRIAKRLQWPSEATRVMNWPVVVSEDNSPSHRFMRA
jgi:hypothetical protein